MLPLAAIEPDGLAITSDGTYVRVIEADHVLQPWRGDIDHRLRLRERLKQLITRIPDRQALQFIVEAEPLDPRRALTQDWLEIRAAMAARRREGADGGRDRGDGELRLRPRADGAPLGRGDQRGEDALVGGGALPPPAGGRSSCPAFAAGTHSASRCESTSRPPMSPRAWPPTS